MKNHKLLVGFGLAAMLVSRAGAGGRTYAHAPK